VQTDSRAQAISLIICAALELCGSLLIQQQGTEGILALTRILLGEGPPLDVFYTKFGKPVVDSLAGQSFNRWPHDEAAVLARGCAMIGRPLRSKKGVVTDFDLATRRFSYTGAGDEVVSNVELTDDVDGLSAFYSEASAQQQPAAMAATATATAAPTLKLLIPANPRAALGRWVLCRVLEDNVVVTEEGELLRFADLAQERSKPMAAVDAAVDPLAAVVDAVVKAYAAKPDFTYVQLPSARLVEPDAPSWYLYSHVEALGQAGGIDGMAWTAATIEDLVHVAGAIERLLACLKPSRALALAAELVADLDKREYDVRGASVAQIDATLQRMQGLVDRLSRGATSLVPHRLSTLLKFITGPVLAQRLLAASLLMTVAEKWPVETTAWALESQALERMLAQHVHVEVVRRASPFVDFLARRGALTKAHLQAVWELSRAGDADLTRAAQAILVAAVPLVAPELAAWLLAEHVGRLALADVDEDRLRFVRDFALASPRFPADAKPATDLLFRLVKEPLGSPALCRCAIAMLVDLAALAPAKLRLEYVDQCIADVLAGAHVAPCLLLVEGLVHTFPSSADVDAPRKFFSFSKAKSAQSVVLHLEHKHKLLAHVVASMDKPPTANGFSAGELAFTRLEFLSFLLTSSSLKLSEKLVESLWHSAVVHAASPALMEIGLLWFGRAHGPISQSPMATPLSPLFERGAPLAEVNPKKAALSRSALSPEAEAWLLSRGLHDCKLETASQALCDVVVDYVLAVNRRLKHVRAPSPTEQDVAWLRAQKKYRAAGAAAADAVDADTRRQRVLDSIERVTTELVGAELLWRLVLECKDARVAEWACLVCAQLHLPAASPKLDALKLAFCARCVEKDSPASVRALLLFLKRAAKADREAVELVVLPPLRGVPGTLARRGMPILTKTAPVVLAVPLASTTLGALRKLVAEALDMPPKRAAVGLRVVHLHGDEMGPLLPARFDEDALAALCLPSATLQVVDADDEEEAGSGNDGDDDTEAGGDESVGDMLSLETEVGDSFDAHPGAWPPDLSQPASPRAVAAGTDGLAAVLPVVDAVVKKLEAGRRDDALWQCLLLLPGDPAAAEQMRAQQWDALLPAASLHLVAHLRTFLAVAREQDAAWAAAMCASVAPAKLLAALKGNAALLSGAEPRVRAAVLPLLLSCLKTCLPAFGAAARAELVSALLATARQAESAAAAQAIALASQCVDDKGDALGAIACDIEALLAAAPAVLDEPACAALVRLVDAHAGLSAALYPALGVPLLSRLATRADAAVPDCVFVLLAALHARPPTQPDAALLDFLCAALASALAPGAPAPRGDVVLGLLRVTRAVVSLSDGMRERAQPSIELVFSEVFSSREVRLMPAARNAALYLLVELSRDAGCLRQVLACAAALKPEVAPTLWGYDPSVVAHPMQYAGVENLGTTCYLNSLVQQLAHAGSFTRELAGLAPSEDKGRLLGELQSMFAHMQGDARGKVFEPRALCGACTEYDGSAIDVMEQKDVQEFSDLLFTRLEEGGAKAVLEAHFGGQLVQTTSSSDPARPHTSEVAEPFYLVPIEVRPTLAQGFEALVRPERLVGDSKYELPSGDKVDGVLVHRLRTLPPHLLIHLKRFEFDYAAMSKRKLDDYCAFPNTLDLAPYSVPGQPAGYYQYELAGILVHAGGPDSGHYFSFIRERVARDARVGRAWYEFNDNVVWPYAPDRIPHDCFGGTQTVERADGTKAEVPRQQSAYVLVYDRVGLAPPPTLPAPAPALSPLDALFAPMGAYFILSAVRGALAAQADAALGLAGFQLGVRFLVEVLARAAPPSRHLVVHEWFSVLVMGAASLLEASRWLVETLALHADQHGSWLLAMLFQCPERYVRSQFCELVVVALHRLAGEPGSRELRAMQPVGISDAQWPVLYRTQGEGPQSRLAWLADALMVCASCELPSDEYFDIVLSLCKLDEALRGYLADRGAVQTFADLFVRGADDGFARQRALSSRHSTQPYRAKAAHNHAGKPPPPQYRPMRMRPLPHLVLLFAQDKPVALLAMADAVVDAAMKRREDDVAAALVDLLWVPQSIISKLLVWAKKRPTDVNVLYQYAVQTSRQGDVASALVFALDDMLQEGEPFSNHFVFQASRALHRLEGSKLATEEFKRHRKKIAQWPKQLARKLGGG